MGYIVASEDTVQAVARQILLLDRQGDQVTEFAVARGLAFWLEFEDESELDRIEQNARQRDLRLLRSEQFRLSSHARRGLRLGFASKTEREAIDSLAILFGNPARSPSVERFNDPSRPTQASSRT